MRNFREKTEKAFEKLSRHIYRKSIRYIIIMIILIAAMSSSIFSLKVDTATESMLHEKDPSLIEYNNYRDQFGRTELVTILIDAPDIFSLEFLEKLEKLHDEIEKKVPNLNKVTSLISIRNIYEKNGTLYVDKLMQDYHNADLSHIKKRALKNHFYRNYIISGDGKSTAIMIETVAKVFEQPEKENIEEDEFLISDEDEKPEKKSGWHYISAGEKAEINREVKEIIKKYDSDNFKLTFSGGTVVVDIFNSTTSEDTKRAVKIMSLVIIFFLFLLFRRFSGVFIPVVIVNTSMISTLGLMAYSDVPISLMTNVLPGFLVAVGIADAVHVLSVFYRKYEEGESKEDAIVYAMGHSGLAVLMTSVTTAAGLLSFAVAEIATISQMGYFASIGVLLALLFTIVLLPALIAVSPIRRKKRKNKEERHDYIEKILKFFADLSTEKPVQIIVISFIIFIVSLFYISKLEFSSFLLSYFPENHQVKKDLTYIESKLSGTIAFEVIIDTGKENGLYDPALLKSIEKLEKKLSQIKNDKIYVGKIVSINDIVKETNMALHENKTKYYAIPPTRKMVADTLFMFENSGSDDLKQVCDSLFSKTRISIRTKWADSVIYEDFLEELIYMFNSEFGKDVKITVTGLSAILARTIPAALMSMLESYIIALFVITILMLFLVGDIKLGLLSMNPNLLPIITVMGLIRFSGLNLDINTLFIGSIALGLVVDDTIHFMYNFKKYYDLTASPKQAVYETLYGTGRAMLITSIVLSLNFFVLLTSELNHSIKFGLFTGIAIILALFADFLLAPSIMVLANKDKTKKDIRDFS